MVGVAEQSRQGDASVALVSWTFQRSKLETSGHNVTAILFSKFSLLEKISSHFDMTCAHDFYGFRRTAPQCAKAPARVPLFTEFHFLRP